MTGTVSEASFALFADADRWVQTDLFAGWQPATMADVLADRRNALGNYVYHESFDAINADELILAGPDSNQVDRFRRMNYLRHKAAVTGVPEFDRQADAIRAELIEANLGLCRKLAHQFSRNSHRPFDDLLSDAWTVMIAAVDKFDFARGTVFSTYGWWSIMNALRLGYNTEKSWTSANRSGFDEGFDSLAEDEDAEDAVIGFADDGRLDLAEVLDRLSAEQRDVVTGLFGIGGGIPLTLGGVSERLGIPRCRVVTLRDMALSFMRRALAA